MGRLFFLGLLGVVSVVSVARPWVGVVAAYLIAILTPQAVWYWNFQDLRPALWVILPTLLGFGLAVLRRGYDFSIVRNRRVALLLGLWLCFVASSVFGPYVEVQGPYRFTNPAWAMEILNKTLLLCLLGCVCINDVRKLKALLGALVVSGIYLTYWANDQYLSGRSMGRLAGPVDVFGIGSYADENTFAMLFVVVLPFIWYMGHAIESKPLRWSWWLIIPFGWHAIFLTASRGGLVGVVVTILLMSIRSRNKVLGLLLLPAFAGAYVWQAGDLMRERAETIGEYQTESSSAARLQAWDAALAMVVDHPVTGVGLASFGPAFPFYSLEKPREAHNTFLQIAAESGLIAGIVFLLIYVYSIAGLWSNGNRLRQQDPGTKQSFLFLANEATLVAFCGLLVCSLFLSLQMFEVFYCLFVLVNSILFLSRAGATQEAMAPTPGRSGRRRGRRGRGSWNSSVGMTRNRDKHGNPWNG